MDNFKLEAAILTELNSPLIVDELTINELKYGQVLVRITKSGLCGAQLQEIRGLKGNGKFLPHLLGHEGCGIVEEVGNGVSKVKIGDKVVLHWRKSHGIESEFPSYNWNGRTITSGKITTLSNYSIISENRMTKIDGDINDSFCALLGCGLSTGLSVVNKEANLKFGESVLILGAGGVGLNCVLASKLTHCSPIVAVDLTLHKEKIVEYFGGELKTEETFFDKYSNFKFDCIIDTTGDMELLSKCIPLLSSQGRCILVSQPRANSNIQILNPISFFNTSGITFKTTQAGGFDPDIDIPKYTKLFLNGLIDVDGIVTSQYSLHEINDAIELLKSGYAGRIMIDF